MDVLDIFYFFSARGREGPEAPERGGGGSVFLTKISGGQGSARREGRGGRGAGRVSAGMGGGLNSFFSGPKFPPNSVQQMVSGELAGECLQTRLTPSESSAEHGLPPQRAPKQCPVNGVWRML